MSSRHDQRRAAVFALYQQDLTGRTPNDLPGTRASSLTRALVDGVVTHRDELDMLIERHARGWSLDRIAPLERGVLRVALLELLYPNELPGDTPIPPEGAIDEAVEIAKAYCGVDAPGFVNGILGAALRELRENPARR